MFPVAYVRSDTLDASGRTIGDNTNPAIHPTGANVTILLGDIWSNLLSDEQYGKWIVVHENNHGFLWQRPRIYNKLGRLARESFVVDITDPNVFPTRYAANNFDTRVEYLVEGMTGLVWDITGEQSPTVDDHVYRVRVADITNESGDTLERWIRRELEGFIG